MQSKEIKSYQEVENVIGKDLAWFALYLAIGRAQEKLHVNLDEVEEGTLSGNLFLYGMRHFLADLLHEHVWNDRVVILSNEAFEEAKEYFMVRGNLSDTIVLSRYLNYLDDWLISYPDWVQDHPIPFTEMMIVPKDY